MADLLEQLSLAAIAAGVAIVAAARHAATTPTAARLNFIMKLSSEVN